VYAICDPVVEDNMDLDLEYIDLLIARASREGTVYKADSRFVHNLILGFVTGQNAEQWIKKDKVKCDGRLDIAAPLVAHYSGAGNAICHSANDCRIEKELHYKNEASMPFEKFLVRCQETFNIFTENDQPMYEEQKVMFLLNHERIMHPSFKGAIDGMLIEHSRRKGTGNPISFTEVANHFSSLVSELLTTKMAQLIGSVGSGKQGAHKGKSTSSKGKKGGNDIYVDGVGHLGYRKDWSSLTDAQQQRLRDGWDKPGLTGGNKEKDQDEVPNVSGSLLEDVASVVTSRLASLNRVESAPESTSKSGNSFGGRMDAANCRRAMAYQTSIRRDGSKCNVAKDTSSEESVVGKCEFDSHADTCVVGKNFVVVSYNGRLCDVAPFSDTYDAMVGVPIVSAATLYTDVQTGVKYILVINEALHMPNLPYSLLNPNQIRYANK
jgi:hypothetical protein